MPASARPSATPLRSACTRAFRWLLAAALVVCAAALAFGFLWPQNLASIDSWRVLVDHTAFMIRTFWFHAALAAAACGVALLVLRSPRCGALGCVIGLLAASPYAPRRERHAFEAKLAGAPELTLFSANLLYVRVDPAPLLEQISAIEPDVVFFQEYTAEWSRALGTEFRRIYPHAIELPRSDPYGQAVFSRVPFVDEPRAFVDEPIAGEPWSEPQISVRVDLGGGGVTLRNVHLYSPTSLPRIREQRLQTLALARDASVLMEREPLVIAGDFNFTGASRHFGVLEDAGLRSTHAAVGSGRGATWPRLGLFRNGPGIRLDHLLFSDGLKCTACGLGEDFGSDHRPVWATFTRRSR